MPFSCAYWLFDLAFYCWPKSDLLIAVHHIAILICNYPVGDNAGAAALAEIHPQCNTVLCSANGYTLEATTFLLYARWLLANTLTRHHWSYYAISALLLGYVRSELFCPAHAGLSARAARLRSSADRVCTRTCWAPDAPDGLRRASIAAGSAGDGEAAAREGQRADEFLEGVLPRSRRGQQQRARQGGGACGRGRVHPQDLQVRRRVATV